MCHLVMRMHDEHDADVVDADVVDAAADDAFL